uniref:PAS domain S-box protein n=1 Tax=Escherichia coli TaxID=562 RepID=UPI00200D7F08
MKLTDAENAADGIFFPALEQNMMGAVLINENDEVMFFNPAAEKLWGYKREEVIGNNIDMLIPRDLRPAHPEYIRHNREGGKALMNPLMILVKIIKLRWIHILSYDQMVSRKINNQTTRCANSI